MCNLIPPAMQEGIEMVCAAVEGQVFYSRDFTQALIIDNDSEWLVRVHEDGYTEEAWLSTSPMEEFLGPKENEHVLDERDLPEMKGFTTGFTC